MESKETPQDHIDINSVFDKIIKYVNGQRDIATNECEYDDSKSQKSQTIAKSVQNIINFLQKMLSQDQNLKQFMKQPESNDRNPQNNQTTESAPWIQQLQSALGDIIQSNQDIRSDIQQNRQQITQILMNSNDEADYHSKDISSKIHKLLETTNTVENTVKDISVNTEKSIDKLDQVLDQANQNGQALQDVKEIGSENTARMHHLEEIFHSNFNSYHEQSQRIPQMQLQEEIKEQNQHLMPQEETAKKSMVPTMILDENKIIKTNEYNDVGDNANLTLMRGQSGQIFAGGDYKQLQHFSAMFNLVDTKEIDGELYKGIAINGVSYYKLGCNAQLSLLKSDTFSLITTIDLQSYLTKIIQIEDDYLLIGESYGYIDIVQMSTQSSVFKAQLASQASIFDVVHTQNKNEYAFATSDGISFGVLTKDITNTFTFVENLYECYFNGKVVECIAVAQKNLLIAAVGGRKSLQVVDRETKEVIKEIGKFDRHYNCLERVIDYDDEVYPYILIKDMSNISIINTRTFESHTIIPCQYDNYGKNNSLIQFKEDNKLKIITLFYDKETKERSVKQFIIAQ